jgi:bacteriocin-like protein
MKKLNTQELENVVGGLCVIGEHGLTHHFGECFSVCNLLTLMNPTFSDMACIL